MALLTLKAISQRANFITLHYIYIITSSLLSLVILYPCGNLSAIDSYFFGASASTESGLNPVDLKDMKTYQQLYVYFTPIITNLGFINIMVVVVRIYWFEKHMKAKGPAILRAQLQRDRSRGIVDLEAQLRRDRGRGTVDPEAQLQLPRPRPAADAPTASAKDPKEAHITFEEETASRKSKLKAYAFGLRSGHPFVEMDADDIKDDDISSLESHEDAGSGSKRVPRRRRKFDGPALVKATSKEIASAATSAFVFGSSRRRSGSQHRPPYQPTARSQALPFLSPQVTIGRNSQFSNLTDQDREQLGGIEYRSLKLLLKIVVAYFFGLHLVGAICLVGWVQVADSKYLAWLDECGQNRNWWAFYSAQTMANNLGLTLTPDSMITFRDATFPMFVMTSLAYAGHTFYPIFLRLLIWTMSKICPKKSALKDPLNFLLEHPRRCYTLLFPSKPTWILFGILFALNFVDILLIIVLDLKNPAVNELAIGPRILAATFQAASARHTGTATFNLAEVNPAVQISLLIMMYISIFPIALSIRASNVYEDRTVGLYGHESEMDESDGKSYLKTHVQNQLSFDLWYIFLGIFCISIAEADKIRDPDNPAFAVFPIFFEVTSAYGNVGLSLGHPTTFTSLSGKFTTFSKAVICAMMIRGRHRGLPYALDRAIMLPHEGLVDDQDSKPDHAAKFTERMDKKALKLLRARSA
ncbi:hypothetical protein DV738_g4525, partial [Chaetothyriales sp. CBS 135597]